VPQPIGTLALQETASLLSDQLRVRLERMASLVRPRLEQVERRFRRRLEELGFARLERSALSGITTGAAARLIAQGRPLADFLEQVEYNGRRLAKLNVAPGAVVEALGAFDELAAALARPAAGEETDLDWARRQLHFVILLALQRAYHRVRETEAQTFYELFRAQSEAAALEDLLAASLRVLAGFCGAAEAHLFLLDPQEAVWRPSAGVGARRRPPAVPASASLARRLAEPRSLATAGRSAGLLLDATWRGRFAWGWSVPLLEEGAAAGVMQFAFTKPYDWLPRERELLEAAAERCLAAVERARLLEELADRERQVRRLAEHMLHVEEVERRRISRELHDETGQSLLYIRLQLEMLEQELPEEAAAWRARLAEIRAIAESTILETRRLIGALSPAVLEQLGLAAAIRQLAARLRQRHPCKVRVEVGELGRLPRTVETVAYRLVQECTNNIARHSRASEVKISVHSADQSLRLSVEDDGIGFCVRQASAGRETYGLAGMRERVALLGGTLEIESRSGAGASGTRVRAVLPIREESPANNRDRTIAAAARVPRELEDD
jgi:signal transduction histidine kinase